MYGEHVHGRRLSLPNTFFEGRTLICGENSQKGWEMFREDTWNVLPCALTSFTPFQTHCISSFDFTQSKCSYLFQILVEINQELIFQLVVKSHKIGIPLFQNFLTVQNFKL
ncbi:hypothetical protein POVWA2_006790 [Plasmodium ovale wallikeri]|uniref:Uncharacterized protein n=1 Tax=Plasmodium ovale wallikeri TaxID=864142 RepID=A0A1A8YK56_PLAOA|nr:hypothetical protein POVWA2_006790 [Plasmodium ovale wallikeri]